MRNLFLLCQDIQGVKRAKIAACITHKGKIIAYGFNTKKTHTFQLDYGTLTRHQYLKSSLDNYRDSFTKYSLNEHAETSAIRNALKRISKDKLSQCELFVCRIKKNNIKEYIYGSAKPCGDVNSGCTKAILDFGLKQVYYSDDDQDVKCLF